ncbi:MAG TPA: glycosyltransferase family 4 protein [Gaiellaceae bacterium]|nr:glycosyltransferase family 4 protein [Gaiellaceae bacterium]
MKIVHLLIGGEVAGGQLVALRLARAARDRGWEAVFVSPSAGSFVELAEREGFRILVVPLGGALDLRSLVRLRAVLRAERADVLHTHVHFSLNVLGRVAGRLAGARVIAHVHAENVFHSGGIARRAQAGLDGATARLCARIIAVSEATAASLVRRGYPAARVVVVHNGIDVPRPAEPRRPAGAPDGVPLLLHVGRLDSGKGQRELIEALARLERGDAVAVLAGKEIEAGGAYERELEQRAAELGVRERVVFAGYRDDVPALLAAADVFVLPSRVEGLPLTVLEAMAAARPVVATRVGGTPEAVVDGETGLLVPPGDVGALVRALDGLLSEPERARRLGQSGRSRVEERFSAEAMSERVLATYAT